MKTGLFGLLLILSAMMVPVQADDVAKPASSPGAQVIFPDYKSPKVVYDFYFDEPGKINTGLYWIRSLIQPLMAAPYNMAPEMMNIVVVLHGTEIVTLAKKNYAKYKTAVERMRYYHQLGVKFHVCGLALHDFGYQPKDMQPFVKIVPSAFDDLAHYQQLGYALITPKVYDKKFHIDEIR